MLRVSGNMAKADWGKHSAPQRLTSEHRDEGLSLKQMLYSLQTAKECLGNSSGRASLGNTEETHYREKQCHYLYVLGFITNVTIIS